MGLKLQVFLNQNVMKLNRFLRWGLFSLSLSAILILTAMNVYNLYEVRDTLIEGEQKKQIALLDEIALNVRRTIYLSKVALNKMDNFLNKFVKS